MADERKFTVRCIKACLVGGYPGTAEELGSIVEMVDGEFRFYPNPRSKLRPEALEAIASLMREMQPIVRGLDGEEIDVGYLGDLKSRGLLKEGDGGGSLAKLLQKVSGARKNIRRGLARLQGLETGEWEIDDVWAYIMDVSAGLKDIEMAILRMVAGMPAAKTTPGVAKTNPA